MTGSELVLEWGKLFLAAPAMIALTSITFLVLFRKPLAALIERTGSIKFPGGGELTTQIAKSEAELRTGGANPPEPLPASTEVPALSLGESGSWEARLKAEREAAYLWEYRYLNYFLARGTQRVLDWLAGRSTPTSFANYDAWLSDIIGDARERQAILNALQKHHLVQIDNTLITVTPKGNEYLEWRGPLPQSDA